MTQTAPDLRMTYEQYLKEEVNSPTKHEFLRGVVYAMAGGTPEHAALAASMTISLGTALRGSPCRVYSSDLRVRIIETDLATYPDMTVVCGQLEMSPDDPYATSNPSLIVEVLSDSTEAYDRGAKAAHYRRIPSLREYVFISHREKKIEIFRRKGENAWELSEYGPGQKAVILGCNIAVDEVYRNDLEPAKQQPWQEH